jgi:ketosteroid isomerase-like protein
VSEQNVEVIRRLFRNLEAREFGANRELFASEVVYSRTGMGMPGIDGEWRGVEEMRSAVVMYLDVWENYRYRAERFVDLGDRVFVLETHVAQGKQSGVETAHEVGNVFTLRDGLITRWMQFWNPDEALEAAGITE